MLDKIKSDEFLSKIIEDTCCENGVCITFDEQILSESYVILKVDKFYNSLNVELRPASIDCLIIRKCKNSGFGLTLVELKNINSSSGFTVDNMRAKFETTLNDFIKYRFRNQLDIEYKEIKLFFVSNVEIYKRDLGLKLEVLMNIKFNHNGKTIMIQPRMPTPTIKNCI